MEADHPQRREGDYRPHRRFIKDPAIGKFCGHEPFQVLPSNSSAALMKALSEGSGSGRPYPSCGRSAR